VRVTTYTEAVRLANAAGMDAAKKRMRKAGRAVMSVDDRNHGVDVIEKILCHLGFDTRRWIAMAGVPRNEPDEPIAPRKRSKGRPKAKDVQLSFAFA
jgi:hypothetical protein